MKIDDDGDEMQKIQRISNFLFSIFIKPRVVEFADGNPADKAGLLYISCDYDCHICIYYIPRNVLLFDMILYCLFCTNRD